MKYLLFYDYIEGIVERRAPLREGHLGLAQGYLERGELLLAGAFTDPVDGALLVFNSREAAELFVREDPYVVNGLVTGHKVREWNVVIGS
ncbi:MAG: YciI family protein [Anaerolineaceae bacterium]